MGGTRPADRPGSAGRWGRQASTDHSHEDGEGAVDAVLFTVQDPRTARHRRVPTAHDQRQRQKTAKHEVGTSNREKARGTLRGERIVFGGRPETLAQLLEPREATEWTDPRRRRSS